MCDGRCPKSKAVVTTFPAPEILDQVSSLGLHCSVCSMSAKTRRSNQELEELRSKVNASLLLASRWEFYFLTASSMSVSSGCGV